MKNLKKTIENRKTFGIISHPDAGKTTLTEKLLLFGGAIHVAGAIKAKKASRHATSDFMEIEKQRGISVATSVMGFNYNGTKINLLDTPGHEDFSEDTYRTLTAVDSTVMVIDCTKGVETQTHKLMNVCRLRNTPIITFINKCDRVGKSPIELCDEIESKLKIKVLPITWPVGAGTNLKGVYHILEDRLYKYSNDKTIKSKSTFINNINSIEMKNSIPDEIESLKEEIELIKTIYESFKEEDYLSAKITPIFFGSAINNFGVELLLKFFISFAPGPLPRKTSHGNTEPTNEKFSGFIFKIHANMDPKHRDRIAFLRVCSGIFERNSKLFHVRLNKTLKFSSPTAFMAQEKTIVEQAYPGDIIGLHDTGNLRIGDTLTTGDNFKFEGIPSFSPELFNLIINTDPLKSKQLNTGLIHLCEEGVAQLFVKRNDNRKIIGVVGKLQFDVIKYRLEYEYKASCKFEPLNIFKAVWITGSSSALNDFFSKNPNQIAITNDNKFVYLTETQWSLDREIKENPNINFSFTSDVSNT